MEYLRNKKAALDYAIEEKIECGIELLGSEVKSVKAGRGSLAGAHVTVEGGELVVVGMHIPPWQEKNAPLDYDPYRTRRLLVRKKEVLELARIRQTPGLTIIPISLYNKGKAIKLAIAVAKGKKNVDKRETLKARAVKRDIERDLAL